MTSDVIANDIAALIGGTLSATANLYSGSQAGDGTGIQGAAGNNTFRGCWSIPPNQIADTPVGIILPGDGGVRRLPLTQGQEEIEDNYRLLILVEPNDPTISFPNLLPYRDTVLAKFRTHMQLNDQNNVTQAYPLRWKAGVIPYNGIEYHGWEFTVNVLRVLSVTYTGP